jgi:hypothetical protein
MFRFEECQSIGGNMRSANSREKVARKIAEAYGWERSSGSGAEEGMVEFMVGCAAFELRVAVVQSLIKLLRVCESCRGYRWGLKNAGVCAGVGAGKGL